MRKDRRLHKWTPRYQSWKNQCGWTAWTGK